MCSDVYTVYRVVSRRQESEGGASLVLDGSLRADPGQFVMVWLPGIEERPLAVMNDRPLSLTIRDVGPFSHAMCRLQEGDRVWVRGPYGHGFDVRSRRMLLVGGGSGIASLTLLASRSLDEGREVRVALGARTSSQLMLGWRFDELGIPVLYATDDGTVGARGTTVDAIEPLLRAGWPDAVYACGPEPMMIALGRRLRGTDLPLYLSFERTMKCGFGVCGNCHLGDQLVCRDGPVFEGERVLQVLDPLAE